MEFQTDTPSRISDVEATVFLLKCGVNVNATDTLLSCGNRLVVSTDACCLGADHTQRNESLDEYGVVLF